MAKPRPNHFLRGSKQGQIVVEYALLLIVGVALAAVMTSQLVSRNPESPGMLISYWQKLIAVIGNDTPDDLKPDN